MIPSLSEELLDWKDREWAAFLVARHLGIIEARYRFQDDAKHVFYASHPLGEVLFLLIEGLVDQGILLEGVDHMVRWNPDYRGSWEDQYDVRQAGKDLTKPSR